MTLPLPTPQTEGEVNGSPLDWKEAQILEGRLALKEMSLGRQKT